MYTLEETSRITGVAEHLLYLWVETKRIVPTAEIGIPVADRFLFSDADIKRVRAMAEKTAPKRAAAEVAHAPGSHYSPQELAALWGLSPDTIRELFENEPDVLVVGHSGNRRKRGYHTLRIPEAVAARVQKRLSNL
jgi:hypothetical protein